MLRVPLHSLPRSHAMLTCTQPPQPLSIVPHSSYPSSQQNTGHYDVVEPGSWGFPKPAPASEQHVGLWPLHSGGNPRTPRDLGLSSLTGRLPLEGQGDKTGTIVRSS